MSHVKADLAELRKQLLASGKTIGFVARESEARGTAVFARDMTEVKMDKFLKKYWPKSAAQSSSSLLFLLEAKGLQRSTWGKLEEVEARPGRR